MAARNLAMQKRFCTSYYNYCDVPLNKAYPTPAQRRVPTNPQAATGSKLDCGTRVITQDNGQATSLVGVFVDAGAVYEPRGKEGVSDFVNKMFFRSNLQSSDFHLYKAMQHAGANYWTNQVGKRYIAAKVEVRRDTVGPTLEKLVESAFIPRFATHEMALEREVMENAAATRNHDPRKAALNQFVNTAFAGSALANDDECPAQMVDVLTHTDLVNWWSSYFTPDRIILAGVNVSQEELKAAYNASEWSSANTADHPSHSGTLPVGSFPADCYVGGNDAQIQRRTVNFSNSQFYDDIFVCYGRKGHGTSSAKDVAAQLVAAYSVGGPIGEGIGMEGLVKSFPSDAVVGGLVRCRPENAHSAVAALAKTVNSVGSLTGAALEAAKKTAAVAILSSVNSREGLLDFLVNNSTSSGVGLTVPAVVQAIAEVSEADLKKLHEVMQSSPATYTAYGDISTLPAAASL
eukprot:TRINITY_DN3360_c0_g1_i1.p1 TRINITY_DN3360_c0_g1~~TRINITY_DN3360_c0_g1_i1.p1  ORF type:complete len:461 (+),score=199.17 TRINITY_DN3360_c0_g1_i1:58-1440(+)